MLPSANVLITTGFGDQECLLLGRKLYGPDQGRLVLPGGKSNETILPEAVEPSPLVATESPFHTIRRETEEEAGIILPLQPTTYFIGTLLVSKFVSLPSVDHITDEYNAALFRSRVNDHQAAAARDSQELALSWAPVNKLPYDEMLPDMHLWLPLALRAQPNDAMQVFVDYLPNGGLEHKIFFSQAGERLQMWS